MRTKIIATIGPRSESPAMLRQLVAAGMDVARMNFSHCTYPEYRKRRARILAEAKKQDRTVAIMQDLQGPRLRVGGIPAKGRILTEGESVVFTTNGTRVKNAIRISDPYLHLDIKPGEPMFLASGEMELVVTAVQGEMITAKVLRGGRLMPNKAINVPRTKLTTSGLTEKDKQDVAFALREGVDWIALSFVQSADDVVALRDLVGHRARIIAKIERPIALENIDAIIRAADAIMIARGDLGTELPVEQVPFVQKNLIRHATWHGKPSITATQMLYSMIDHPHPTRAEVSDVANAVLDGSDAVMLSDETASGEYPLAALTTMVNIVKETESYHRAQSNPFDQSTSQKHKSPKRALRSMPPVEKV